MKFICLNGIFLPSATPVIQAGNRSFKWGDGIFETMRVHMGHIHLESFHFERLFQSLKLLQISTDLDRENISRLITDLCRKNDCMAHARVRLAVFREDENGAAYIIEAHPLPANTGKWMEKGLAVDIYPFARKSMDAISNIKSASYLTYVLAGLFATEHGLDDSIVLNAADRICDSSRANIFIISNNEIYTPALSEGCINGVMRRMVIEELEHHGYTIHQAAITPQEFAEADSVFFTNAIMGIRWVHAYRDKIFNSRQVFSIYQELFSTIAS